MSEFIGSRISLISRSDIRYVGILHEINSENSTVALEQVVSFGTEGRRGDAAKEIPATDNVYEYIVFRGSDVKDLRIEEPAKTPQQKPPQVPDDPAILQSTARPPSYPPQGLPPQYPAPPMHPYYQQNPAARYGYPPNPYGYPGYPPVGPPGVGQFPPQAPQQASQQQQQPQPQPIGGYPRQAPPPQAPIGPAASRLQQGQPQPPQQTVGPRGALQQALQPQAQQASKPAEQQPKPTTPVPQTQPAPSAPTAKPLVSVAAQDDVKAVAPQPVSAPQEQVAKPTNNVTSGANGRTGIVPALPLAPAPRQGVPTLTPASVAPTTATNAATAPASKSAVEINDTTAAVQDLAHKVSQLKASSAAVTSNGEATALAATDSSHRPARQPTNRGRGGFRAGLQQARKVEIPAVDFDFESANAKFNKQDLIKEVIASEDVPTLIPTNVSTTNGAPTAVEEEAKDHGTQPDGFYSKKKSFFDNISCENKERAEAKEGDRPRGGAQWRGEETKKNIETFGQGSVDGGNRYVGRGGWRGRGRGFRGGYRGRGVMRGSAF